MKKIAIVHFQPLELYPPVTNFINYISDQNVRAYVKVFSTASLKDVFKIENGSISISRYGRTDASKGRFRRMFQYLLFYTKVLLGLIRYNPEVILYYESLSFLPVYLYYKISGIFRKSRPFIYCHYHEYSAPEQYDTGMFLERFNHKLETTLYQKMKWISHTNKDRLDLFLKDNAGIEYKNTAILPNYPPKKWMNFSRPEMANMPVKIIYVGAIGMDTMYISEFADWVELQEGKVIWDIYSQQDPSILLEFLQMRKCKNVYFKGKIEYNILPVILTKYDVGVVLYKGHIPNYIYNAPNKLFEYAVCGLDVWFPKIMVSSLPYATNNTWPKMIPLDFSSLGNFTIAQLTNKTSCTYQPHTFNCESVLKPLLSGLIQPD